MKIFKNPIALIIIVILGVILYRQWKKGNIRLFTNNLVKKATVMDPDDPRLDEIKLEIKKDPMLDKEVREQAFNQGRNYEDVLVEKAISLYKGG